MRPSHSSQTPPRPEGREGSGSDGVNGVVERSRGIPGEVVAGTVGVWRGITRRLTVSGLRGVSPVRSGIRVPTRRSDKTGALEGVVAVAGETRVVRRPGPRDGSRPRQTGQVASLLDFLRSYRSRSTPRSRPVSHRRLRELRDQGTECHWSFGLPRCPSSAWVLPSLRGPLLRLSGPGRATSRSPVGQARPRQESRRRWGVTRRSDRKRVRVAWAGRWPEPED